MKRNPVHQLSLEYVFRMKYSQSGSCRLEPSVAAVIAIHRSTYSVCEYHISISVYLYFHRKFSLEKLVDNVDDPHEYGDLGDDDDGQTMRSDTSAHIQWNRFSLIYPYPFHIFFVRSYSGYRFSCLLPYTRNGSLLSVSPLL